MVQEKYWCSPNHLFGSILLYLIHRSVYQPKGHEVPIPVDHCYGLYYWYLRFSQRIAIFRSPLEHPFTGHGTITLCIASEFCREN